MPPSREPNRNLRIDQLQGGTEPLYDYIQCPHRVTMDLTGDPTERDAVNPFVELLWERGNAFEHEVIKRLAKTATVLDLSGFSADEKEGLTRGARWRPLNTPHSNGSTGSTTAA